MIKNLGPRLRELSKTRFTQPSAHTRPFDHSSTVTFQIKAVERLVVAERENISSAFERQRAEGLASNDEAFEQNLSALDEKAGKSRSFPYLR